MSRRGGQAAVVAAGAAVTALIAWRLDMPVGDFVQLLGLAAGGAVAAAVVGVIALSTVRTASIRAQAVIVALIAVSGTMVGVGLAANAMFVSSHDLGALVVVMVASATVAIAGALAFGSRIGTASTDLVELARRLGDGDLLLVGDRPVAVELRRLAAELESASARLDEARRREQAVESARRELVAWVSHDLRTPLTAIRAMAEALEDGVVDDPIDVVRYHATIRRETDRLSALVDDLFELSRIEAGAVDLRRERVPIGDVIGDAVAGLAPVAAAKGVQLSGDDLDGGPVVEVAPAALVRVVRNLIDNAVRHTPAGGRVDVHVDVADGGDEVILRVCDGCGGIPAGDLGRVFDPAFRGDAARGQSPTQGGGLGLAIARGLVAAHGGRISVANVAPGCCFTVALPRTS